MRPVSTRYNEINEAAEQGLKFNPSKSLISAVWLSLWVSWRLKTVVLLAWMQVNEAVDGRVVTGQIILFGCVHAEDVRCPGSVQRLRLIKHLRDEPWRTEAQLIRQFKTWQHGPEPTRIINSTAERGSYQEEALWAGGGTKGKVPLHLSGCLHAQFSSATAFNTTAVCYITGGGYVYFRYIYIRHMLYIKLVLVCSSVNKSWRLWQQDLVLVNGANYWELLIFIFISIFFAKDFHSVSCCFS